MLTLGLVFALTLTGCSSSSYPAPEDAGKVGSGDATTDAGLSADGASPNDATVADARTDTGRDFDATESDTVAIDIEAGVGPAVTAVIGPDAGSLVSSDGKTTLTIPAGALSAAVTLTMARVTSPSPGTVGPVYEIGPSGTTFSQPAILASPYDPTLLGATDPSEMEIAYFDGTAWQPDGPRSIDTTMQMVYGAISHLSEHAPVLPAVTDCCNACEATACTGSGGTDLPPIRWTV
jgi:hypothetical protein